jgi:hypothetical protein
LTWPVSVVDRFADLAEVIDRQRERGEVPMMDWTD